MPARRMLCLLCGLLVPACGAAEHAQTPAHPSETGAEKLVGQLGSEEYSERVEAYARLRDLGLAACPALRARRDDPDLEVQTRARLLLDSPYLDEAQVAFYEFLRTEVGPVMGAKSFGPGALKQGAFEGKPFDPAPAKDENGEETAVDPTLEWLARNQEADGHWDSLKYGAQCEADLEQTAMVLLSILGTGNTEKAGRFRENVGRGLAWLAGRMNEEGIFLNAQGGVVPGHAQAMATLALSEAAAMGRVEATRSSAGKAARQVLVWQSERSRKLDGWGKTPRSARPDLFTTAWFLMALKSAQVGGLIDSEFLRLSQEGANRLLDRLDEPKAHAFRHAEGAAVSPQATALGLFARTVTRSGGVREENDAYLMPLRKHFERALSTGDNNEGPLTSIFDCGNFAGAQLGWQAFYAAKTEAQWICRVKAGVGRGSLNPCGLWAGMGRVGSTAFAIFPYTWILCSRME